MLNSPTLPPPQIEKADSTVPLPIHSEKIFQNKNHIAPSVARNIEFILEPSPCDLKDIIVSSEPGSMLLVPSNDAYVKKQCYNPRLRTFVYANYDPRYTLDPENAIAEVLTAVGKIAPDLPEVKDTRTLQNSLTALHMITTEAVKKDRGAFSDICDEVAEKTKHLSHSIDVDWGEVGKICNLLAPRSEKELLLLVNLYIQLLNELTLQDLYLMTSRSAQVLTLESQADVFPTMKLSEKISVCMPPLVELQKAPLPKNVHVAKIDKNVAQQGILTHLERLDHAKDPNERAVAYGSAVLTALEQTLDITRLKIISMDQPKLTAQLSRLIRIIDACYQRSQGNLERDLAQINVLRELSKQLKSDPDSEATRDCFMALKPTSLTTMVSKVSAFLGKEPTGINVDELREYIQYKQRQIAMSRPAPAPTRTKERIPPVETRQLPVLGLKARLLYSLLYAECKLPTPQSPILAEFPQLAGDIGRFIRFYGKWEGRLNATNVPPKMILNNVVTATLRECESKSKRVDIHDVVAIFIQAVSKKERINPIQKHFYEIKTLFFGTEDEKEYVRQYNRFFDSLEYED